MKKKILLFHYTGGGGGKFIANCLSFSGKVAIADYDLAESFSNNKNLSFLEKHLLDTIPEKNNSRQWHQRERGCRQLFGNDIDKLRLSNSDNSVKLKNMSALGDQWLPIMSHTMTSVNNLKKFFANDTVFTVLVDGTKEFIDLAIRLKWPEEHHCLDLDIFNKFKNGHQTIDFDYRFDDWNPLDISKHVQISQLAEQLGCNFDLNLASNYIKKYVDFHIR
jgi:hypothetical protein